MFGFVMTGDKVMEEHSYAKKKPVSRLPITKVVSVPQLELKIRQLEEALFAEKQKCQQLEESSCKLTAKNKQLSDSKQKMYEYMAWANNRMAKSDLKISELEKTLKAETQATITANRRYDIFRSALICLRDEFLEVNVELQQHFSECCRKPKVSELENQLNWLTLCTVDRLQVWQTEQIILQEELQNVKEKLQQVEKLADVNQGTPGDEDKIPSCFVTVNIIDITNEESLGSLTNLASMEQPHQIVQKTKLMTNLAKSKPITLADSDDSTDVFGGANRAYDTQLTHRKRKRKTTTKNQPVCEMCNDSFPNVRILYQHMVLVHKLEDTKYHKQLFYNQFQVSNKKHKGVS